MCARRAKPRATPANPHPIPTNQTLNTVSNSIHTITTLSPKISSKITLSDTYHKSARLAHFSSRRHKKFVSVLNLLDEADRLHEEMRRLFEGLAEGDVRAFYGWVWEQERAKSGDGVGRLGSEDGVQVEEQMKGFMERYGGEIERYGVQLRGLRGTVEGLVGEIENQKQRQGGKSWFGW